MGSFTQDYVMRLRDMPVLIDGKTVRRCLYLINDHEAFVCIDKGYRKVVKTDGGQWVETAWTDADSDLVNDPRFAEFAMFRQKGDRR